MDPILTSFVSSPIIFNVFGLPLTAFVDNLTIHIWKTLGRQLESSPRGIDIHASTLAQRLRTYTLEAQQAQTTIQRIQYALSLNSEVAVLEYYLLWGKYGYSEMIKRLLAHRPFQGFEEAMQFALLPMRYCFAMELKTHVARIQSSVRQTYESERFTLINLTRGANEGSMQPQYYTVYNPSICGRQLTTVGTFHQLPGLRTAQPGTGETDVRTVTSEPHQTMIEQENRRVDNLRTVIWNSGVDLRRVDQHVQRVSDSGRQEPRQLSVHSETQPSHRVSTVPHHWPANVSAAHSHPLRSVLNPRARPFFPRSTVTGSEHRTDIQNRRAREYQESEDDIDEDEGVHMRGGEGANTNCLEDPETPGASTTSGEPMSMSEFDQRIGNAIFHRFSGRTDVEPGDMLQWIMQNIVNRIVHQLQVGGISFLAEPAGTSDVIARLPSSHRNGCDRCSGASSLLPSPGQSPFMANRFRSASDSSSSSSATYTDDSVNSSAYSSISSGHWSHNSSGSESSRGSSSPDLEHDERGALIMSSSSRLVRELIDLNERTRQLRLENSTLQQRLRARNIQCDRACQVMLDLVPRLDELIQLHEQTAELRRENSRLRERVELLTEQRAIRIELMSRLRQSLEEMQDQRTRAIESMTSARERLERMHNITGQSAQTRMLSTQGDPHEQQNPMRQPTIGYGTFTTQSAPLGPSSPSFSQMRPSPTAAENHARSARQDWNARLTPGEIRALRTSVRRLLAPESEAEVEEEAHLGS